MTTTYAGIGTDAAHDRSADLDGACLITTQPTSFRSTDMLLLSQELARAQCSARHEDLANTMRLARLAAVRRHQRRAAAASRRAVRLTLAAAR